MLNRVLAVALAAGLVAGLAIAVLQHFTTTPLILAGEAFEKPAGHASLDPAAGLRFSGATIILAHSHGEGAHDEAGWSPTDGLERTAFTSLATVVTAIGFALILMAGLVLSGDPIDGRRALAWAAAAFIATGLAPALGLAPELPGSAAAPLLARQIWWMGTAVATAAALWLLIRTPGLWAKAAGLLLLLAPHVIGAPRPEVYASGAPAELAGAFAATSLVVNAALWASVAVAVGFFWQRFKPHAS
ncbi:CbtA family protein [Chelatococcus sp. GCM10030263]|uniref:CbtA family protein n=1 Tax=Chelatococcus sp. GCM10030263 TaxID=3273387 RepID=UPI003618ADDC